VEKAGTSNEGIVQQAIRLRCFRKHKLKDPKGKEEEEEEEEEETPNSRECGYYNRDDITFLADTISLLPYCIYF
jgi:hypothetical protein